MTYKSEYYKEANKRWPKNCWVEGDGPFALVAYCRDISISLHKTQESANADKDIIDQTGCGGACAGSTNHRIHDLRKSLEKIGEEV